MRRGKQRGRYRSFGEFWPFYLKQHSKPATRWIHFFGTNLGLLLGLAALILGKPWWLLAGLVAGYAPAWFSHFFVERNRPATFQYPFWSLAADFRMAWGMWRGLLENFRKGRGFSLSS